MRASRRAASTPTELAAPGSLAAALRLLAGSAAVAVGGQGGSSARKMAAVEDAAKVGVNQCETGMVGGLIEAFRYCYPIAVRLDLFCASDLVRNVRMIDA